MPNKRKWAKLMCSTCGSTVVIDASVVPPIVEEGEHLISEIACPHCDDPFGALCVVTLDVEEAAQ